jgi:hypothetical protein
LQLADVAGTVLKFGDVQFTSLCTIAISLREEWGEGHNQRSAAWRSSAMSAVLSNWSVPPPHEISFAASIGSAIVLPSRSAPWRSRILRTCNATGLDKCDARTGTETQLPFGKQVVGATQYQGVNVAI